MNEIIVDFRGAKVLEFEARTLQDLENRNGRSERFRLVDKLDIKGLGHSLPLQFSVKDNHIDLVAISDPNYCEYCQMNENFCKNCGYSTLPESLGNLESLKELFFVFNEEIGLKKIPKSMIKLKSLEKLTLRYGHLIEFPEFITELKSLRFLDLSGNKLKKIPHSIELLTNLESLDLKSNHLTDLPESVVNLKSLKFLNIATNKFSYLPDTIFELISLKKLISRTNKVIQIPELVANLNSLEVLDLSENQLISLPDSIGNLISIEDIDLKNNQLNILPDSIGNLKKLKELNIEQNKLTKIPESFGNLKSLKVLNLVRNRLVELPYSFGDLESLKYLHLDENSLTKLPESIGNLNSLEQLYISSNQLENLPDSIDKLQNLYHLNLSYNKLRELPKSFENVRSDLKLVIWDYKIYSNMTLEESLNKLKSMQKYYGKIVKGITSIQQNSKQKRLNSKTKSGLIKYPSVEILKKIFDRRKNVMYVILWMLKNNEVVEWKDFFVEPLSLPQSTLSNCLIRLQEDGYIERVRRGAYKITIKGKNKYDQIERTKEEGRSLIYPPKSIYESTDYEDIILWMFYNNEYLEWYDFVREDSPVGINQSFLSKFIKLLLKNGLIIRDDKKKYKITQKGKIKYVNMALINQD